MCIFVLVLGGFSQECIEDESNQDTRNTLGGPSVYDGVSSTMRVKHVEICGDGGFVTCISVDGSYGIDSFQFECSNGYKSQDYRVGGNSGPGTKKCANGGIYNVHGLESMSSVTWGGFGDGGFSGYSSSGSDIEIGFGSVPSDYKFDRYGKTKSCQIDTRTYSHGASYAIGFKIWTPPQGDGYNYLFGISLICSDYETCPQDGLYVESADNDDDRDVDMENDDDMDMDTDDFEEYTSGSGGKYILNNIMFVCLAWLINIIWT